MDLSKKIMKKIKYILYTLVLVVVFSCEDCECIGDPIVEVDCTFLGLNIGDECSRFDDGILDGIVNDVCECEATFTVISECPGFMQNADFEITTGDPNLEVDDDINLATGWKPLWQSGSLADLFDENTTNLGSFCFDQPVPPSGVFAGMWVENNSNSGGSSDFREGFFNEMTATVLQDTGTYTLSFDHAHLSANCGFGGGDVKVGVYGVNFSDSDPLPLNPTNIGIPTNLDLFGASNTVLLAEITIPVSSTNTWTTETVIINTNELVLPVMGFNHIMITHTDNPFDSFGRLFMGFDNFCIINE